VGRETDLEQRERKNQETDDYRRERQLRLGHVSASEEVEEEEVAEEKEEAKPKAKSGSRAKQSK
jgi:hypothetical protein